MRQQFAKLREIYDNASIAVAVKLATSRAAQVTGLMAVAGSAHAVDKISGLTSGWTTELSESTKFYLLAIAAAGICLGSWSTISAIMAKKNQEPLKWQGWGLVGGGAAVIVPVLILAFAGSIGGGSGGASTTFTKLGIQQ